MAPSLATPTSTTIAADSQEDLSHFISIITAAFSTTALTTAFIVGIDSTPPPYPSPLIDSSRRQKHFSQGILDSAATGAELVQAGNWSAIALWEPPSYQGKAFSDSKANPPPLLSEWRGKVKQAKAKYLAAACSPALTESGDEDSNSDSSKPDSDPDSIRLRPFYHLSFLARNPAVERAPGSMNAVMTPFLERAKAENVPAWLEATNPKAVKMYLHFGFRIVETIIVGKGKVNAAGWPAEGEEACGVTAWAMIYDGHLTG